MASVLVTWACGHFCIRHSTGCESTKAFIEAATDDFCFLSSSAQTDLANIATSRHIMSSGHCPKCQEPVGPGMWKLRAHQSIEELLHLYESCKTMYLEAGAQYYMLDFSQKAKHANDSRCASAHEQFWLSKTPRHLDPLFAPMEKIVDYCHDATSMLQKSKNRQDIICAFERINKARAKVGRLIGPLEEIISGIELMSTAKSKRREDEDLDEDDIPSREDMVSHSKMCIYLNNRMGDWGHDAADAIREAMEVD